MGRQAESWTRQPGELKRRVRRILRLKHYSIRTEHRFTLEDFKSTIRYSSAHDINFASAFAMGRELGYDVPVDVRIYGIEVQELRRFAEGCTPIV